MREPLKYLKCVVFVRATADNVQLLARELRSPRYAQYYVYLSNVLSKTDVKTLAEADEHECVREMHEFYCDYVALLPHLFTVDVDRCYVGGGQLAPPVLQRCVQALTGVLLSLKRGAAVLRYETASAAARALAEGVRNLMNKEAARFDTRKHGHATEPVTVLVVDRRNDCVSPLLSQWTYQAMVHELLTINNNRVSLTDVPGADAGDVVLSPLHDSFYAANLYSNFGEIAQNIKQLMDEYQTRARSNQKLESIADMKSFVENYPQFRRISGTLTKHVTLVGELSRLVSVYGLLDVSETEQMLACHDEHAASLASVRRLIAMTDRTSDLDATRLVMLYALHYERHANNDLAALQAQLRRRGVPDAYVQAVNDLLAFGGQAQRTSDLFGNMTTMSIAKKLIKGLKGVENIYTQHTPYLKTIVDDLVRARLKDNQYAFLGLSAQHTQQLTQNVCALSFHSLLQAAQMRVRDVVVFVVGGVTYEESACVHALNQTYGAQGVRIVLGGTHVLNARAFIDEIMHAARPTPAAAQPTHRR